MMLLQERLSMESNLISVEADLKYNTDVYDIFGDGAHKHMIEKITQHITLLREEYRLFELKYSKEKYPEIWI